MSFDQSISTVNRAYLSKFPAEAVSYLRWYPADAVWEQLKDLDPREGAPLFERLNPQLAANVIAMMPDAQFSEWAKYLDPGRLAPLLARLSTDKRLELLSKCPKSMAKAVREALVYPPDRAGSLMDPSFMVFSTRDTVGQALERLRGGAGTRKLSDLYVTDDQNRLAGKVSIQEIALSTPETTLKGLMAVNPPSVYGMAFKEDVIEVMERFKVTSIPVIDNEKLLIGVIRYDGLVEYIQEQAVSDMARMVGAGSEEKALSPVNFAVRMRLPWLSINLLTTFLAAFVVGIFEGTIEKVTALAVLLPIVAGQSGNTGAQAQAVTLRGIALREFKTSQVWRLLWKEGRVGFINSLAIGVLCGVAVYIWSHTIGLGVVISVSMVLAMVTASLAGAAIPVILKSIGQDPAQSSSIILTTVTDIVGFFSFLGLATLFSKWLI